MSVLRILAIETSCDETALAIVDCEGALSAPRFTVRKHVIASQIETHRPFGGVVPNLAKREHLKNLPLLFERLRLRAADWEKIACIAVTVGPGLEPALWTGINFAKNLSKTYQKPLLGANHIEGHLYSFLLEKRLPHAKTAKSGLSGAPAAKHTSPLAGVFPAIGLVVSGGHTILLHLADLKTRTKLGETRDDAVGEAYDKVARLLNLPYPGGPEIEKIAAELPDAWEDPINFPRPMIREKNYDFSFSGLKTAVLYHLRDHHKTPDTATANYASGNRGAITAAAIIARAFQEAAVDVLVAKTMRAAEEYGAKSILLSGGVSANKFLRGELARAAKRSGMTLRVADFIYSVDNAAMIAVAAYLNLLKKKKFSLVARGDLKI